MPNKQAMSNYWAFLADPSRYRIEEAVRELKTDTWVTKGRPLMAGDKILIWKSAGKDGKRGVIALGEVLTDPQMLSDSENLFWVTPPDADNTEERVQVRYVLWPGLPLWLNEHDALNSLSISRARGGTVFRVTPEQYQAVTTAAGGLPEGATVLEPLFTDHDGSAPRNPAWSREELMLALDLFFQLKPAHISKDHPEIIALSQLLNALPIHTDRPDVPRFRNPKGVSMKLSNFLRLDPTYLGVRLEREGKMEETIWDEFAKDRDRLHLLAEAIRAGLTMTAEELLALPPPDEDFEAPEGRLLLRVHKYKERNPSLVQRKKSLVLQKLGVLRCEACGLIYSEKYGPLGDGYIECHHTIPVSQLRPGQTTSLKDLALVCADCHRMLHRGGDLLTVADLAEIVVKHRTKQNLLA